MIRRLPRLNGFRFIAAASLAPLRTINILSQWKYIVLSLAARGINVIAVLLLINLVSPASFGEFAFLQASAALMVSLCGFGIEISVNSAVSSARNAGGEAYTVVLAGALVVICASLLATASSAVIYLIPHRHLPAIVEAIPAIVAFSIASFCIAFFNALCYSASLYSLAAVNAIFSSLLFAMSALLAPSHFTGLNLFVVLIGCQTVSLLFFGVFSLEKVRRLSVSGIRFRPKLSEVLPTTQRLLRFGIKQSALSGIVIFGYWLLQYRLAVSSAGMVGNAVYALGNQIFNLIVFVPAILSPIIVSSLSRMRVQGLPVEPLCYRVSIIFFVVSLFICGAVWAAFETFSSFLAYPYRAASPVIVLAAGAACLQLVKAPFSIYFTSSFRTLPDFIGIVLSSGLIVLGVVAVIDMSPTDAMGYRLFAQLSMTVFVIVYFIMGARSRLIAAGS